MKEVRQKEYLHLKIKQKSQVIFNDREIGNPHQLKPKVLNPPYMVSNYGARKFF